MESGLEIAAEKARLRLELKNRFKQLKASPGYENQRQKLIQHLTQWLQNQQGTWTIYSAMESELNVQELIASCPHLKFVHPRVTAGEMHFLKAGPRGFEKHPLGMMEPIEQDAQAVKLADISGFLVPGLGFDPKGVRMGRGKGFYDQVLEKAQALGSPIKVGITLVDLMEPRLPEETRKEFGVDVRMDFLATDSGVKGRV